VAAEEGGWTRYFEKYVAGSEAGYAGRVGGAERIRALPIPTF
jgi:glutaconate CoA-transferase, subunit A